MNTFRLLVTHVRWTLRDDAVVTVVTVLFVSMAALWTPSIASAQAVIEATTASASIVESDATAVSRPLVSAFAKLRRCRAAALFLPPATFRGG